MDDFQKLIDDIREKADIVKVIGGYVNLEKHGSSFVGLCPFHDDKNPSMSVSPTKKIFKCFSCNASGNVITFIEKYKKIPFIEALRELGKSVGIDIAPTQSERIFSQNQKYYDLLEDAARFYEFYLKNTLEGQHALEYLYKRKLTADIISRFRIGLSGTDANDLYKALTEKKHLAADMLEVGIIKSGKDYYDTFRKRIMFPITDLAGHVVGFSGRIYAPSSNEPKYINSNENIVFKKSQILYHFHEAFQDIKRLNKVFLFEGFMDVIAAYRAGVTNTVASMGTALTYEQIKAIKNITNQVVICYDGDQAGIDATIRAIKMLVEQKVNVMIASMPDGIDPDDFINKHGKDNLRLFLEEKNISAIAFLYQVARKNLVVSDMTSVEQFKKEVFGYLSLFASNVITETYIKAMAKELNISYEGMYADFENMPKPKTEFAVPNTVELPAKTRGRIKNREKKLKRYETIQKELICIALNHPEKANEIESKFDFCYFSRDYFLIMSTITKSYALQKHTNKELIKQTLVTSTKSESIDAVVALYNELLSEKVKEPDEKHIEDLLNEFSGYKTDKELVQLFDESDYDKSPEKLIHIISIKKLTQKNKKE